MDTPEPKYHKEFLVSPHHVVFGLLTLGLGFLWADWIPLIAGATAYSLGWIYLPDLGFFRQWVDRKHAAAQREEEARRINEFTERRMTVLNTLSQRRRERYQQLAMVCRDIERAGYENPMAGMDSLVDPRLRKLDELMWTFLRLLGIEESLERFLETERRENLPTLVKEAEAENTRLKAELETLQKEGAGAAADRKQRFLSSRTERLEVLRKRQQRVDQAQENLALVISEQDRLDQQIKLLRADAVAAKNTEALTARIDATVEHLDQTNKWLAEMDEFKDLTGDMPVTDVRVGYEAATPPPILPTSGQARKAPIPQQEKR